MRLFPRRGWTLVELCVTMAVTSVLLCVALRLVFLTERAIRRETEGAGSAQEALYLVSTLAEDTRLAERISVKDSHHLTLALPEGWGVQYAVVGGATRRQERGGGQTFEGIVASFSSDGPLLRATVTRPTGETLHVAILPRNLGGGEAW